MPSLRIATWNMKQGVAPRQKAPALWDWISRETNADLLVLTEARVTKEGIPDGWHLEHVPGGIGGRRNYGTIIAARGAVEIQRAKFPRTGPDSEYPHPATTLAVEVFINGQLELVVLGAYGLLNGSVSGLDEFARVVSEFGDIVEEYGLERLVIAGDFNLWPDHLLGCTEEMGLIDVTSQRRSIPKLRDPVGGSRIWTHKNGAIHTDGARQEIDFIFVSEDLRDGLREIMGGVDDFPDA